MRRPLALASVLALSLAAAPAGARDFLGDMAKRAAEQAKAAAAAKAEAAARQALEKAMSAAAAPAEDSDVRIEPARTSEAAPAPAPTPVRASTLPDDDDWAAGRARLQAPHLRGRVSGPGLDVRDRRVSKAEGQAMTAAADALVFGPLMATPALADPRGFSIRRSVIIDPPSEGLPPGAPAVARGHLLVLQIQPDKEQPDAAGTWRGWGEGPGVEFTINDPAALFFYPGEDGKRPGHHSIPVKATSRDGFLVVRFSMQDHLVITRPGTKQPWRHVTKAEVLERRIEDTRESLAKWDNPSDAPLIQQDLAKYEAELAGLSPAERAEPACDSTEFKYGTFTPCHVQGAQYVVAYDPGYFDPSLPKTAIQLLVISEPVDNRDDHRDLGPVLRGAVRALDLKAIQAQLR